MQNVISDKCREARKLVKTQYKIRPDGKKYTGRPTKMTTETLDRLKAAFLMGCSDIEACQFADISKTALYNYQNENPDFVDQKERWKEQLTLKARSVIAKALNNNEIDTAKWYMERKRKSEFSIREEFTGADGESLQGVTLNIIGE
jgi:hypothetical protein